MFTATGIMMFIQWYQPLESKFANRLETFNEVCILCLSYHAMCFTDFVPDPVVRNDIGKSYIATNASMIMVHFVLLINSTIKAYKESLKKKKLEKNKKAW